MYTDTADFTLIFAVIKCPGSGGGSQMVKSIQTSLYLGYR